MQVKKPKEGHMIIFHKKTYKRVICANQKPQKGNIISCVSSQVLGKVNTISVEKTDGCQMFVNKVRTTTFKPIARNTIAR